MNSIPMLSLLGLMLLMHMLADGKQKGWWEKVTKDMPDKARYRNDWAAAMACHALYWSLMICLPFISSWMFLWLVLANAVIHFVVDDLKANRHRINLIQDQTAHLVQIVATWLFVIWRGI